MRFFTIDWWNGEDENDPLPEYQLHFESIRSQLPEGLVQLHDRISLHDGWLRQLIVNVATASIRIHLDADDGRGGLRKIEMRYEGVSELRSNAEHEKGLGGPKGYGDLGYDEIDVVDGFLVHRMLFSGNIEIEIVFRDFNLAYIDVN